MARLIEIKMQLTLEDLLEHSKDSDVFIEEFEAEMRARAINIAKEIVSVLHNDVLTELIEYLKVSNLSDYQRDYDEMLLEKIKIIANDTYKEQQLQGKIPYSI
jgi:RNA processing factor Prp31